eukprot:m.31832 g.31832  ORF g.31832 m.31832 type:complete len:203 (-) comp10723_c0_seq1:98-706(-)
MLRAVSRAFRPAARVRSAIRNASDVAKQSGEKSGSRGLTAAERPFAELTVAEKVVETSKDAGSLGVILLGAGLGGVFLLSIGKQLLFKETPRTVYTDTVKRLEKNDELQELLGSIESKDFSSGFNPFRHTEYISGDYNYLRLQFDVQGTKGTGTVHAELKKPTSFVGSILNSFRYRYLLIDVRDAMSQQTKRIILEDNRSED